MDLISVIMPNFNGQKYIREAIESVLHQDHSRFELIVVDDGSTDESVRIIKEYMRQDTRVRLFMNHRSKGVSGARNTGIEKASGEWICFLDSDDIMVDGSLSVRLSQVAMYKGINIVSGDLQHCDDKSRITSGGFYISKANITSAMGIDINHLTPVIIENGVEFFLSCAAIIFTGTPVIRHSVVERTGFFCENMAYFEDLSYWFRMILKEKFLFIPDIVFSYRQHQNSVSSDREAVLSGHVNLYRYLANLPEFSRYQRIIRKKMAVQLGTLAYFQRKNKKFNVARQNALKAIILNPYQVPSWKNYFAAMLNRG